MSSQPKDVLGLFVLNISPLPPTWIGRTVDDVSTVCPPRAVNQAKKFVKAYRYTLNIGAASEDPAMLKAFDSNTSGEILGVWFNTVTMTWQLAPRKLNSLVNMLVTASKPSSCLSLHDVEVLHGKLVHIAQLAPLCPSSWLRSWCFSEPCSKALTAGGKATSLDTARWSPYPPT